jgi:hypothetical protein
MNQRMEVAAGSIAAADQRRKAVYGYVHVARPEDMPDAIPLFIYRPAFESGNDETGSDLLKPGSDALPERRC